MLIHALIEVAGPLLTKTAIDRYLSGTSPVHNSFLDPYLSDDPFKGLSQVAVLYLITLFLALILEFAQNILTSRMGQSAMYDLRHETMAHMQRLDVAYYDRTPIGRLLTRVT